MKTKTIIYFVIGILFLAFVIYFNLPKEEIIITNLPPIKQVPIIIP